MNPLTLYVQSGKIDLSNEARESETMNAITNNKIEWVRCMAGMTTVTINGVIYRKAYSSISKVWRVYRQDNLQNVVTARTDGQVKKQFAAMVKNGVL